MRKYKNFVAALRDMVFSAYNVEEIISEAQELGRYYRLSQRKIKAGLKKAGVVY